MRGEYKTAVDAPSSTTELPPRARRIPGTAHRARSGHGTTSACAENTVSWCARAVSMWNYLRVRGEYTSSVVTSLRFSELPPRARRILSRHEGIRLEHGTTSACAENTSTVHPGPQGAWNYLRVRGEYVIFHCAISISKELPPRARRILTHGVHHPHTRGTTSACAENTLDRPPVIHRPRNYLRVRGEYRVSPVRGCSQVELPPRTRRIRDKLGLGQTFNGTTSAHAENTV